MNQLEEKYQSIYIYTHIHRQLRENMCDLHGWLCRSRHTGALCFCIDWVRPVWLVWPAGGTLPLLQSTGVCHNQQAGSWCRAAKVNWDWLVHTASVEPESHCPWPEGSGPDCTAALWTKGEFRKLGMFESPRLQQGTTPRRIKGVHIRSCKPQ